jgi:hypothetical protein
MIEFMIEKTNHANLNNEKEKYLVGTSLTIEDWNALANLGKLMPQSFGVIRKKEIFMDMEHWSQLGIDLDFGTLPGKQRNY